MDLPQKTSFSKGFSLIELLVVIAIIAFLSSVGMAVYADAQSKGRDTKRRADIDSLAKVLELHKEDGGTYQPLNDTYFSSTAGIPTTDPKTYPYCIKVSSDVAAPITNATIPSEWTTTCPATWEAISSTVPANTTLSWGVCTMLENSFRKSDGSETRVYCRYNVQ